MDGISGGAHFHGFGDAGETGQTLRACRSGDEAEFYFWLTDLCAGDSNAIMAGHSKLEAAAERIAVNGDDDGLGAVFHFQQERKKAGAARLAAGHFAEFLNVGAGDESAATANQDSAFDGVVFGDLIQGVGNALRDAGT